MGKRKLFASAVLSAGAFFLFSCGDEGSPPALGSGEKQTSSTAEEKFGVLKLGVKFPSSGELMSQFIDQNIQCIYVEIHNGSWYKEAILTPDNPTVTISNIPLGSYIIHITAYDGSSDGSYCTGNVLDSVGAYADISEGTNSFTINLLRAKWIFVDSNNNPVAINLNGTLSTSNESINGFYVLPPGSFFSTVSIDPSKPAHGHYYDVYFFGNNLDACNATDPTLCYTWGYYYLQLIGPNTSNNAFETAFDTSGWSTAGLLQPGPNGELRMFFVTGMPPCTSYYDYYDYYYNCSYSFSNPSIENYMNTTVTSSDTMQGNIAEMLLKNYTEQFSCYLDPNDPQTTNVLCPTYYLAMRVNSLKKAVLKAAAKNQLSAQQTCMQDVTLNQTETWKENTAWYGPQDVNDIDGDGDTWEFLCDNNFDGNYDMSDDTNGNGNIECWESTYGGDGRDFYVDFSISSTFDVCFHPFTAKAQQIPTTELSLIIQNR